MTAQTSHWVIRYRAIAELAEEATLTKVRAVITVDITLIFANSVRRA